MRYFVFIVTVLSCHCISHGASVSMDTVQDSIQTLEEKIETLTNKVTLLTRQQNVIQKTVGISPTKNNSLTPEADIIRSNLTSVTLSIEAKIRELLGTLASVTRPVPDVAVCSWDIGLPSDLLTSHQEALFLATVGSSHISCRPNKYGWLTILRRVSGSVGFSRGWEEYKYSFGDPDGNFWLGLELVHHLTATRRYKLKVDVTDFSGTRKTATYDFFRIGPESQGYKLTVSGYNGTAGDGLSEHNNMKFSTVDLDNDQSSANCATTNGEGGWWYKSCDSACLTGVYYTSGLKLESGVEWTPAFGDNRSLKLASMRIRPVTGGNKDN